MNNPHNPTMILRQIVNSNPRARQVMQMMQNKNPHELRQIAENIAANQGTTIDDVARSLGITIPSER